MNSPIFVRGMSRSGGTLAVTLLDAHSEIAMIYEFYPNLMVGVSDAQIDDVISTLERTPDLRKASARMPTPGLNKLVKRLPRARLSNAELAEILKEHRSAGMAFDDDGHRLRFIERCGLHNMRLEGKPRWGSKCGANIEEYRAVWPEARFVNIIRDGRDVLASQLNTGDFKTTPSALGKSWAKNHTRFRELMRSGRIHGHELVYERLVRNPEKEVACLLDFLEVSRDISILNFHMQSMNIFRVGHMSKNALVNPVNASQVGRWERDLSPVQVREFLGEAAEAMAEFGYSP